MRANGELNEKYPGGADRQKQLLKAEGHTVIQKGKRLFVQDYQSKLAQL